MTDSPLHREPHAAAVCLNKHVSVSSFCFPAVLKDAAARNMSSGVEIIQGIMRHAWSQVVVEEGVAFKMLNKQTAFVLTSNALLGRNFKGT